MRYQRWTIDTSDDRLGDGQHHPYVVEAVTEAVERDGVLYLFSGATPLGAFPLANVTDRSFEEYEMISGGEVST